MTSGEIRKKYLDFFKARGHVVIPSASLVPENDPTTLFTGSGMQPLIPYLLGTEHPEGKRLVNSQKSFRAEDIDEVGDNRHTTFFEMLGNWSLGDYWKQEQLSWFFEFLTEEVGLVPSNLYVTVFSGGEGILRDDEAIGIWKQLFADKKITEEYAEMKTEDEAAERGMKAGERIFGYGVKKNWWSRAGVPSKMPIGEPGGSDSEVFYDFDPTGKVHGQKFGKHCHPNCDCGRFMEIGNSVFMEYKKSADGTFEKLKQRNVDFGGGLERITAASNNNPDIFKIDIFQRILIAIDNAQTRKQLIEEEYEETNWVVPPSALPYIHSQRVIADHIRAATFLISDGIAPSNTGRGYVVRRLLRRAIRYCRLIGALPGLLKSLANAVVQTYVEIYPQLSRSQATILSEIEKEENKFGKTLDEGLKKLNKLLAIGSAEFFDPRNPPKPLNRVDAVKAFEIYQSYGFPLEMIQEELAKRLLLVDEYEFQEKFQAEFKKHQELSRTASAGTFKGGLADHSEQTTRLHTAHHLLLKALQIVLGPQVKQRGSNITSERLRMDFSYDAKMTDEQKREVERIVNEKIAEDIPVIRSEMPREEAEKLGAEHEFGQKYPERVSVYSVGPKGATADDPKFEKAYSIEFCGGPHVTHTGQIGHFKVIKEESVAAGVRRIRGVVE